MNQNLLGIKDDTVAYVTDFPATYAASLAASFRHAAAVWSPCKASYIKSRTLAAVLIGLTEDNAPICLTTSVVHFVW